MLMLSISMAIHHIQGSRMSHGCDAINHRPLVKVKPGMMMRE